jgi:hypothetical protein
MHELGEIQGLDGRAQIARICHDLVVLGRLGADLLQCGLESPLGGRIIFGEVLLRQRVSTAVGPGMMQGNAIRVSREPMGLRCELNQPIGIMAKGGGCGRDRLWLVVVIVRAVVHVIVELGPHLLLQVILCFINLLL